MDEAKGNRERQLRLWPGVIAGVLLLIVRFGVPLVAPQAFLIGMLGGLVCTLLILVWWCFFSRAPQMERWGAIVLMIIAMPATRPILDVSLAKAMVLFLISSIPGLGLALIASAAATRRM